MALPDPLAPRLQVYKDAIDSSVYGVSSDGWIVCDEQ